MGLDMYLKKKIYVGANHKHLNVKANVEITVNGRAVKVDVSKISEITESTAYWCKANQIHNWFVTNVQDGKDDCQESYVSHDQLMELKALCEEVLKTKDSSKLPPKSGFFFGSTDVDEYYFQDLEDTIKQLSGLDPEGSYYYQASW